VTPRLSARTWRSTHRIRNATLPHSGSLPSITRTSRRTSILLRNARQASSLPKEILRRTSSKSTQILQQINAAPDVDQRDASGESIDGRSVESPTIESVEDIGSRDHRGTPMNVDDVEMDKVDPCLVIGSLIGCVTNDVYGHPFFGGWDYSTMWSTSFETLDDTSCTQRCTQIQSRRRKEVR
jgi:hypothetical protein